ncbi:MAG: CaiB/BaiF CoA transferase family protein [Burkholderiaceae bacterium]
MRVLDFSHVVAGPLATLQLSLLGAEVLKVEGPGGDVMRRSGQGEQSFVALNAGKRPLHLDLRRADDLAQARTLAADCDVLVDNLRPGALEGLGLGFDAVSALNPRIVYCAISGFGREGAWSRRLAYDHVVQAATGMAMLAGTDSDPPIKSGYPGVDAVAGLQAAMAIVCALRERDRSGRGLFIDVSMTGAALQLMYPFACDAMSTGASPPRVGNQGYSGSPAADFFASSDGWIAVGANTPRQLLALLDVLGLRAMAHDPAVFEAPPDAGAPAAFVRARDPQMLKRALAQRIAGWAARELEARLVERGVPAARVRRIGEFVADARAAGALADIVLAEGGVSVRSPGLGYRVRRLAEHDAGSS